MERTQIRVLLADDDAHIRRILALKLELAGYAVTAARDGREALEAARETRPDVLVTDYSMPEMTGLELCRALERDPATAGIATIMLSSHDFKIGPEQTQGTSIKELIGKPFSPRQLIALVASLTVASQATAI